VISVVENRVKVRGVISEIADEALRRVDGDRRMAYVLYKKLIYKITGSINPDCYNKVLQLYYDFKELEEIKINKNKEED